MKDEHHRSQTESQIFDAPSTVPDSRRSTLCRLPFSVHRLTCIVHYWKQIIHRSSFILLLALIYAAMLAGVLPALPGRAAQDGRRAVVRIRAATAEQTWRLVARGLDLLEGRDGADLFAILTPAEQAALVADGFDVRIELEQTAMVRRAGLASFGAGYRTVEETEQFLRDMAGRYPTLATLVDFGDSWQRVQSGGSAGYDLLALRLTNQKTPGPKPVFFLMAAIHARELTTSELATRFIEHLLANYGVDPDITWLLDEHEIVVAPMINPDGRKIAEQGFFQRKNVNPGSGGSCAIPPEDITFNQYGVDLNRNSSFRWGAVDSATTSPPCSQTYPGSGAVSEPETQALQQFITMLYPSRPRPGSGAPAPDDTSGILISLHSFYDLVLWPWGSDYNPAPNGAALQRLGTRLADFNGYEARQSVSLYPTSGTTDEWAYAELGIAAYTFEIGPFAGPCGGFMPPYSCLDSGADGRFWPRNLPALLYAARVARAPYSQPAGPDIRDIRIVSDTTTLTLTATVEGRGQPVSAAEVYAGLTPRQGGVPIAFQPLDGAFDETTEQAQVAVSLGALPPGSAEKPAVLLSRGQSSAGVWGPISAAWARPTTPPAPPTETSGVTLLLPIVQRVNPPLQAGE